MAGGGAVEQLREKLPWLLRGGALVSAGALVGLGLGVAVGMPGMIGGGGPDKPRTRRAAPQLAARAPAPAPSSDPEPPAPAPGSDSDAAAAGTASPPDSALGRTTSPQRSPGPGTPVIQVAATPFRPLADAVRKRLADAGYESYVDTVVLEGRQRFRVRVDSAGRDAPSVAEELRKLGYPVWVTQE